MEYRECDHCGETSKNKVIVPKPFFFFHNDKRYTLPQIFAGLKKRKVYDTICIDCLMFEIEERK